MLFSESWLREWVDPAISSEELMARITMAGLEVDGAEAAAKEFTGVVVGEVLSTTQHPDADKLMVCEVSDGKDTFQVVCGAPNVCAGLRVPFAKVGAKLAPDFRIRKAKLRGVESNGMLCSAEELGLEEKSEGLLELPADAPVGEDIRGYLKLDDSLIEVDLTPNRGDCLSIRGLARELGVLTRTDVTPPELADIPASIDDTFPVTLESPEDCPRYLGRVIRGIRVGTESPLWLKEKLRRSGIRSIDPVVDVTNYVLIELGHPMHAFDLAQLSKGVVVRRAKAREKLTLLDGKDVELRDDTLVIADHDKALAIAGVMGGEHSGVSQSTNDIFLESAFFNPLSIAGKARSYGLQTDAAHRYERGVDHDLTYRAMERATELLLQIVGGEAGPVITAEAGDHMPTGQEITLRTARITKVLGAPIEAAEVEDILARLGLIQLSKQAASWTYSAPSWRFDLAIEEDLIEEIARVHGYDNLPVSRPAIPATLKPQQETRLGLKTLRRGLVTLGYQEVVTYSFVEPALEDLFSGEGRALKLLNPISQDMAVMRTTLWGGLLKTLKHNQNRQQSRVRIFESGLVFTPGEKGELSQRPRLAGLVWGSALEEQWGAPARTVDFFDAKGDLEQLLNYGRQGSAIECIAATHAALQPGQSARLVLAGKTVGWLGALNPLIQKSLDIPSKVYLFEVELDAVSTLALPVAKPLSRFPSVRRDIAFVIDREVPVAEVLACLRENEAESLIDIVVFDLYDGEKVAKSKKSLALGLTFQHASRTLTDDEINSIIGSGIKLLQAKFNVELRN